MSKKNSPLKIVLLIVLAIFLFVGSASFFSPSFVIARVFSAVNSVLTGTEEVFKVSLYFLVILKMLGAFCLSWSLFLLRAIRKPEKNIFVIRGTSLFLFLSGLGNFWFLVEKEVTSVIHPALIVLRSAIMISFAVILYLFEPKR